MLLSLVALITVIASYEAYQRIRFTEKLRRVQNSAARLVFDENKCCHITPFLRVLHWLPVKYQVGFKILLLTFKAIHKLAPTYISDLVSLKDTGVGTILDQITANLSTFRHTSLFPRLVIDIFVCLPLNYGTTFPFLLEIYPQLMISRRLLKLTYFRRRFLANLFIVSFYKEGLRFIRILVF